MKKITLYLCLSVTIFLIFSKQDSIAKIQHVDIRSDTYVEEMYPTVSPWNNKNLYIGKDTWYGKGKTRAYVRADLTGLENLGIIGRDIVNANLYLYQYENEGNSPYTLLAFRPKENWNERLVNWSNQPNNLEQISSNSQSNSNGWKKIDITKYVKNALDDDLNYGVNIKLKTEDSPAIIFWSTACVGTPTPPSCNPTEKPYVQVEFTPNAPPNPPVLLDPQDDIFLQAGLIHFEANSSTDPNGEKIQYRLEISKSDSFETLIYKSQLSDIPRFDYTLSEESKYFWRMASIDEHGEISGKTYSETRTFFIDKTPPTVPIIDPEPPFTNGTENTITWSSSSDNYAKTITYRAEISETEDFSKNVNSSEWLTDLSTKFTNLEDNKHYYYRVKSRDDAKNTSEYSSVVSSTQDNNPPQIKDFRLSTSLISPFNPSSKSVRDYTEIKGKIEDPTLRSWKLLVVDQNHKNVSTLKAENNVFSFSWPQDDSRISKLSDGKYFAYINATDSFGKTMNSKSLEITIDDTSPATPTIENPKSESYSNSHSITLISKVEKNTSNNIYLNDILQARRLAISKISQDIKIPKDGKHSIKVESLDEAGNKSSTTVTVNIDTSPPNAPEIELHPDSKANSISISIKGEKETTAKIYINGKLTKSFTHTDNKKTDIVKKWTVNQEYKVFATLVDRAGNISPKSKIRSYKTPDSNVLGTGMGFGDITNYPKAPKIKTCTIKVHKDRKIYDIKNCNISAPSLAEIENRGKNGNIYWLTLYGSAQKKLKIKLEKYRCKKKSIFDPRTWFFCIDQKYKQETKTVTPRLEIISRLSNGKELYEYKKSINTKGNFYSDDYTWYDPNNKKVSSKSILSGYLKVEGIWIDYQYKSGKSNSIKVPKESKNSGKYFSFVFNEIIGVTQWHGYTAYQSPHTGIDFGAVEKKIISPANGYIRAVGWDSYYGQCLSGGNYIRIEHDNGMHTVYMHLKNYTNSQGKKWKVGQRILRGQQVGISGNSGAWNCQPLGYHLHFELRKSRSQSTHLNPVPYIDINWNLIHTIGSQNNPGRLTGDNPHPSY
ncbi:DNRLRE domain-containing protein [Candidatus Dojkabacteria bacterium]|nr:DNRLRE domain-containing protein [Candidatus Dojkabacteria bacterium]